MSKNKELVGGEDGYFPEHSRRFPRSNLTIERIEIKREQLRKRRELWDAERELEDEILEFRIIQDAWLEELVTLDEILEWMMETGLCKKLSKWRERL